MPGRRSSTGVHSTAPVATSRTTSPARAAPDVACALTAGTDRVATATTVTTTTATGGRDAVRTTASTGAGRVTAARRAGGVPMIRSDGTARMRMRRWMTSAVSDQWAARSAMGQVRATSRRARPKKNHPTWRGVAAQPLRRTAVP